MACYCREVNGATDPDSSPNMETKKVSLSIQSGSVKLDRRFRDGFRTLCGEKNCSNIVRAKMIQNTWISGLCQEHFRAAIQEVKAAS